MKDCDIYRKQSLASLRLSVHAKELCALIDEYLKNFDRRTLFSFSVSPEKSKEYKKEYYDFLSKLPVIVNRMDKEMETLGTLLAKAEEECRIDLTVFIAKKTDSYVEFEQALAEFTQKSRALISENIISPAPLINVAGTFRTFLEDFIVKMEKSD